MRRIALTILLATITSCASKDVPDWMRAILDSRPQLKTVKGFHVHRSQYPEDPALKAAGALLARPPVRNPVIVALTTTPTRVAAVEPAVRSLLNQSQPALIVVSIPDARDRVLHQTPTTQQTPHAGLQQAPQPLERQAHRAAGVARAA